MMFTIATASGSRENSTSRQSVRSENFATSALARKSYLFCSNHRVSRSVSFRFPNSISAQSTLSSSPISRAIDADRSFRIASANE